MTSQNWNYVFNELAERSCTPSLGDRLKQVLLLKAAKEIGQYQEALKIVAVHRSNWKVWIFQTQRQWQCETKRKSRARHPDSISIREKYVRC